MAELARITQAAGLLLGHLLKFRNQRLACQMKLMIEYGDICRMRLANFPVVLISSGDLAQSVLVENAPYFVKSRGLQLTRPLLGNGLLTSEYDVHRRHRKLISPGLQHKRVGTYAGVMAGFSEQAQARWKEA